MKLSGGAVDPLPRAEEADYARGTTFHAEPSSVDAGIAHVRDALMPALEGIEGFIGLSLLPTGRPAAALPLASNFGDNTHWASSSC